MFSKTGAEDLSLEMEKDRGKGPLSVLRYV